MFGSKASKEKDRYYLLAGMGGEPARRKRKVFLAWSLIVAILVSFGLLFLFLIFDRLKVD